MSTVRVRMESVGSMPSPRRLMTVVSLPTKIMQRAVRAPRTDGANVTSPRPCDCAGNTPGTCCSVMRKSCACGPSMRSESAVSAKRVVLRSTSTTVESRRVPTRTRCISTSRGVRRGQTIENSVSDTSVVVRCPPEERLRTIANPSPDEPVICCCVPCA